MKILCVSDTHGLHNKIPKEYFVEADMIIHAGDCTNQGYLEEINQFLVWFNKLDYKYKIFIAGNHDFGFQEKPNIVKEYLKCYPDIIYLEDEEVIIEGIKFYGSPQTPYFYDWAFNCARNQHDAIIYNKPLIKDYWDKIPNDVNVLITHGPPYEIGDFVPYRGGEYVGCRDLLDRVVNLEQLKYNIFGHIHYSYGEVFKYNKTFINASNCTESYEPINKPILIEI